MQIIRVCFFFTWDSRNAELPCCKNTTFSEISLSSLVCLKRGGWRRGSRHFPERQLGSEHCIICAYIVIHAFLERTIHLKSDLESFQVSITISEWATLFPEMDAHTIQDISHLHKHRTHKSGMKGYLAFHRASLMALIVHTKRKCEENNFKSNGRNAHF